MYLHPPGWKGADSALRVDHTHTVLHHIRIIEQAALKIESAARGYGITGIQEFVDRLDAAEEEAVMGTAQLRKLTIDNPLQQENVHQLATLIEERIAYSNLLVKTRDEKGLVDVAALSALGRGMHLTDTIHALSEQMIQLEEDLLSARKESNDKSIDHLNFFSVRHPGSCFFY
ncbi:MAG: CHASE3 domain-containing protein [Chitinophagaceae bacterium]|nr:CHASE3 domain-containing protein [Chitinophagaceae bacterium]